MYVRIHWITAFTFADSFFFFGFVERISFVYFIGCLSILTKKKKKSSRKLEIKWNTLIAFKYYNRLLIVCSKFLNVLYLFIYFFPSV